MVRRTGLNWMVQDMPNYTSGQLVGFEHSIWNDDANEVRKKEIKEEKGLEGRRWKGP